jgi:hypothetical protein
MAMRSCHSERRSREESVVCQQRGAVDGRK